MSGHIGGRRTDQQEARFKFETFQSYASPDGSLALFSGWAGIDLSTVKPDQPLDSMDSNPIQGLLSYFKDVNPVSKRLMEHKI